MAKTVYQILVELEGDQKAKAGLEQIGTAAGVSGAALTTASVAMGKMAADYEFALQKITTVGNETTGNVEQLDSAFYELSEQMNGAINVNEAAVASYDVVSAGYKDQADILAILKTSQEAAVGGFSDLATVSDATTTIMNAFGDSLGENLTTQERAQKVTDLLIQTQNDGKTTVDQLASSYGNIAATAAAAGVEFEVVNAVLANSTAQGLTTSSAVAGLKQVIAGIQKPTSEAAEEAERLGISFDAASLKTEGLDGILLQIANSTNLADDSIAKLFGSTEAQTVVNQALANSGQNIIDNLNNQTSAIGTTSAAYEQMADTDVVKAQQAFNKLQNTLVKLGQGVLVAAEPAIEALEFLVDNFNKLPGPMQKAIGLAGLISGVALTAAGAILIVASNVVTMTTNIAAAIPKLTLLIGKLTAIQGLSLGKMAAGMKAFGASAAAAAPLLTAAAGAVAAVTLAFKQYQNIQTQFEMAEIQGLRQQTEPLVQAALKMRLEMEETGKAIPTEKFDRFIAILEEANSEHGELTGVIEAMKNAQAEATRGTEESTSATEENTGANQDNKLSEEELAQAEEDRARKFAEYVQQRQQLNQQLDQQRQQRLTQIDLEKTSEAQAIEDKLAANREFYNQQYTNQKALLQQSQLTADQRRQIEIELQQTMSSLAQAEADARAARVQQSINQIQQQLAAAQSESEAAIAGASVLADLNSANLSYVSSIKGLFSEVDSLINDTNSSLQFRNELWDIGIGLNNSLVELGLLEKESNWDNIDLLNDKLAMERIEIQLKLEQLRIEREIIALEAEGRRAEIEGQLEIARIQRDNAQTDEERQAAEAILDTEQRKLEILDRQTEAKLKQNQLNTQLAEFEGQIANAKGREARRDAESPSGQAGQPVEPEETQAEKETAEATKKTAEASKSNLEATGNVATGVDEQATESKKQTAAFENSTQALNGIARSVDGILDNTSAMVRQLDFIQKQLKAIPSQIAAKMPRPRPSKPRD